MKTTLLTLALALSMTAYAGKAEDLDKDFDRLDGKGPSGKRVDVIEWEGNLEIHVYPGGSLKGLALKLDKRNKDKPVMVIGYRFENDAKKQLIRRAILGIPMNERFHAFRDPSSGSEYDKIVISNHVLSGQMMAYKLDPPPTQLYPEGHPALREVASTEDREPAKASEEKTEEPTDAYVDEDGRISPFFMGGERKARGSKFQ